MRLLARFSPSLQWSTGRCAARADHRALAFTFGLLHGFAFASSLADIGLPAHNIPGALLLFNCAVQIGQLMFVSAVLVAIAMRRRLTWPAAASCGRWIAVHGIGGLAFYWMLERVNVLILQYSLSLPWRSDFSHRRQRAHRRSAANSQTRRESASNIVRLHLCGSVKTGTFNSSIFRPPNQSVYARSPAKKPQRSAAY